MPVDLSLSSDQLAALDPLTLQAMFSELHEKQLAANRGEGDGLTAEESRFAISITRILRRTNTGPAKAKTTRAKKPKITATDIDKMFDL
jgi:hypothetical protein